LVPSTSRPIRAVRRPAFTLVEVLIVVILLGILAMVVIPQFRDVSKMSNAAALRQTIYTIRSQLQVYRNEHGTYPLYSNFEDQMTQWTDCAGNAVATQDATHTLGPYLDKLPDDPISGLKTIRGANNLRIQFAVRTIDGGWWYNTATGEFRADLANTWTDEKGTKLNTY
jgi:general secretion pathway protein G